MIPSSEANMTPQEMLREIEEHFKNMNNFGWPEDVMWLIARVKQCERGLTAVSNCGEIIPLHHALDFAIKASIGVLETMPKLPFTK